MERVYVTTPGTQGRSQGHNEKPWQFSLAGHPSGTTPKSRADMRQSLM